MIPVAIAGITEGEQPNTVTVQKFDDKDDTDPANDVLQAVLTHGSVNHSTKKGYIQNPDDTKLFLDRGTHGDGGSTWKYQPNVTVLGKASNEQHVDAYMAFGWQMRFRYSFAGDANLVAIYLDLDNDKSYFEADDNTPNFSRNAQDGKLEDTAKGFRISFMGGTHTLVWGNHTPDNDVFKSPAYKGECVAERTYAVNDYVLNGKRIYKCVTAVATSTNWNTDKGNFKLAPLSVIAPNYTANEANVVGDTAKRVVGGVNHTYVCKNAIVSAPAEFATTDWDEVDELSLSYVSAANAVTAYSESAYVTNKAPASYDRLENLAENETWVEGTDRAERITVIKIGQVNGSPDDDANNGNYGEFTINCAAWYEGTDPNVISGAAMASLKAHMTVYARRINKSN